MTTWRRLMAWGSATVSAAGSSAVCEASVADQPVARSLSVAAPLPQPAGAPDSSLADVDAPPAVAAQSRCRATFWLPASSAGSATPSTVVFSQPGGPATASEPVELGVRPLKRYRPPASVVAGAPPDQLTDAPPSGRPVSASLT